MIGFEEPIGMGQHHTQSGDTSKPVQTVEMGNVPFSNRNLLFSGLMLAGGTAQPI